MQKLPKLLACGSKPKMRHWRGLLQPLPQLQPRQRTLSTSLQRAPRSCQPTLTSPCQEPTHPATLLRRIQLLAGWAGPAHRKPRGREAPRRSTRRSTRPPRGSKSSHRRSARPPEQAHGPRRRRRTGRACRRVSWPTARAREARWRQAALLGLHCWRRGAAAASGISGYATSLSLGSRRLNGGERS